MKHIFLILLLATVFWFAKMLALILIYASPDEQPHLLPAAMVMLGAALFVFSAYYNIEDAIGKIMRGVFVIFGLYGFLTMIGFALIARVPKDFHGDYVLVPILIFFISGMMIAAGVFLLFKKKSSGDVHA